MTEQKVLETVELHFLLEVEDEWPPVAVEGVPCAVDKQGYRILTPPLFIKGLSVGDLIFVEFNLDNQVVIWRHLKKSNRTTIWLLRMEKSNNLEEVLNKLKLLNCNMVQLPQYGCYSIDVPGEVAIKDVDNCLALLDQNQVAVAFPSFRH